MTKKNQEKTSDKSKILSVIADTLGLTRAVLSSKMVGTKAEIEVLDRIRAVKNLCTIAAKSGEGFARTAEVEVLDSTLRGDMHESECAIGRIKASLDVLSELGDSIPCLKGLADKAAKLDSALGDLKDAVVTALIDAVEAADVKRAAGKVVSAAKTASAVKEKAVKTASAVKEKAEKILADSEAAKAKLQAAVKLNKGLKEKVATAVSGKVNEVGSKAAKAKLQAAVKLNKGLKEKVATAVSGKVNEVGSKAAKAVAALKEKVNAKKESVKKAVKSALKTGKGN